MSSSARATLIFAALAVAAVLLWAAPARAHKPSDAYVTLAPNGSLVVVRWDVAVRDLDFAFGLDADRDGKVTWREVEGAKDGLLTSLAAGLSLSTPGAGACELRRPQLAGATSHSDGEYAVFFFEAACPAGSGPFEVHVRYNFLFDVDPSHRAVVALRSGEAEAVHVLSKDAPEKTVSLAEPRSFSRILREGVFHIWTGYDHMLFLLALLLPAVLERKKDAWEPRDRFRAIFVDVAKIVTSFTAAHSITLSLVALGLVALPSRLVESVVAASVVVAAINNVRPILRRDRWMAGFVLGLMHGFAFSSSLAALGLARGTLLPTLVGFNLGVEAGQLAVVGVFLPLAFLARKTWAYEKLALRAGSVVIAGVAAIWLIERAMDLKIITAR